MNQITRDNCPLLLAAFIEENDLNVRRVAKVIGCSEATLVRILAVGSLPSDEMMKQVKIMIAFGFDTYSNSKLSNAPKEHKSEVIGFAGGSMLGIASITTAIDSLGEVEGFSAAGMTSGLATLGSVLKGGMKTGFMVVAAIPIAAGATGYAFIKGVKYFASEWQLNVTELDERWEIPIVSEDE